MEIMPKNEFSSVNNNMSFPDTYSSSLQDNNTLEATWVTNQSDSNYVKAYFQNKKLVKKVNKASEECKNGKCKTFKSAKDFKSYINKETE